MDIIDRLHQKLEKMDLPPTESHNVKVLIRQALQAGLACNVPTDPLEGYANLTAAIKAGDPIDWEQLNGRKVKCVNPELRGEIHGKLVRNKKRPADKPTGWWDGKMNSLYVLTFNQGWGGQRGWTLWIEGEIPLRRKTADQLEVGTYFLGKAWDDDPYLAYVGRPLAIDRVKTIYYAPEMLKAITPASEWVVIEELGTFQKPEENKK